jgi:hypothetical protein
MKKNIYFNLLLIALIISGCASLHQNYGQLRSLSEGRGEVTIQSLIETWEDYGIYYAGFGGPFTLGILFDPKNNDTTIVANSWKKVQDKETLQEIVKWIKHDPLLKEVIGPDGGFYGYLYYSKRHVTFKMIGDKKMQVFNLEHRMGN